VENHDHCVYDFVEVRDGHEDSSRLLGKFCGHRMPSDVKSTTNKMYVKFVSDASVQKGGFAAVFVKGQHIYDLEKHYHFTSISLVDVLSNYKSCYKIRILTL